MYQQPCSRFGMVRGNHPTLAILSAICTGVNLQIMQTFQGLHSYVGTTRNQAGQTQSTCIIYENTDHYTLPSITCLPSPLPSPPPVALISFGPGGGHLCLKFDIILVKKNIHVIRVVFRTRRCTCVHRLGVQSHAKLEKRVCFCHFYKFWKRHGKIKEKTCN